MGGGGLNGQLHAPAALPLGKEPPIPIGWEDEWLQRRSGHCGGEENLLLLAETEARPSSHSLYRLSHPGPLSSGRWYYEFVTRMS
jgi:hypothetical protein